MQLIGCVLYTHKLFFSGFKRRGEKKGINRIFSTEKILCVCAYMSILFLI